MKLQTLLVQLIPNCTASHGNHILIIYVLFVSSPITLLLLTVILTCTTAWGNGLKQLPNEYKRRVERLVSASAVGKGEGVANDRSIHKAYSLVFGAGTRP